MPLVQDRDLALRRAGAADAVPELRVHSDEEAQANEEEAHAREAEGGEVNVPGFDVEQYLKTVYSAKRLWRGIMSCSLEGVSRGADDYALVLHLRYQRAGRYYVDKRVIRVRSAALSSSNALARAINDYIHEAVEAGFDDLTFNKLKGQT